jgi:hypothetical protein
LTSVSLSSLLTDPVPQPAATPMSSPITAMAHLLGLLEA